MTLRAWVHHKLEAHLSKNNLTRIRRCAHHLKKCSTAYLKNRANYQLVRLSPQEETVTRQVSPSEKSSSICIWDRHKAVQWLLLRFGLLNCRERLTRKYPTKIQLVLPVAAETVMCSSQVVNTKYKEPRLTKTTFKWTLLRCASDTLPACATNLRVSLVRCPCERY